jgi:hypothetical protein
MTKLTDSSRGIERGKTKVRGYRGVRFKVWDDDPVNPF